MKLVEEGAGASIAAVTKGTTPWTPVCTDADGGATDEAGGAARRLIAELAVAVQLYGLIDAAGTRSTCNMPHTTCNAHRTTHDVLVEAAAAVRLACLIDMARAPHVAPVRAVRRMLPAVCTYNNPVCKRTYC